ncbi:hypothetical protein BU17DRAFT_102647 [Hysterangium stoloniferum]|nr:hypothetical protein BU17DRAFT_102647 [Hysterangium stoloniferum]
MSKPTVGLFVPLNAKAEKGVTLSDFLVGGRALVDQEPETIQWYGIKFSDTKHAIFDTFPTSAGKDAHLSGKVAEALMVNAPSLLDNGPEINSVEILGSMVRPESATNTAKLGLYVPLHAKPEKAEAVKEFLISALPLVQTEPETLQWFAYRVSETEFGIFDTAAAESGIQAHLNGPVAAALMANADALLAQPPNIQKFEVLALKIVV